MKQAIDDAVDLALGRWMDRVEAHPRAVVWTVLLLTLVFAVYAAFNLGVNSDNLRLVSDDLPSRKNHEAFAALFPNLENALFVVIDGETPELTREASVAIEAALRAQPDRFTDVYLPGGGEFFERNGLLYRSVDELDRFADRIARIQPILAELERDSSVANLAQLVQRGIESSAREGTALEQEWPAVLDRVGEATVNVYTEYPVAVSWEDLLLRGTALDATTRRVIVVHPVLDFDNVLAAGSALDAIRGAAAELGYTPERGVRVRVTGNPALNYEEMIGLAWDIGGAGVFCFGLVAVILYFALRSKRLVTAAVATLLAGLIWTAAFAAAAIGHLNIVSLAVAILFIGLGVDFAIHLGASYADKLRSGSPPARAMREATEDVGSSLVLCTFTTAIGFYVFMPTDYRGVAELGAIAGTGMIIIVSLTLSFFPALLATWLRFHEEERHRSQVRFQTDGGRFIRRYARGISLCGLLAAVAAAALIPRARFDPNVVAMRDRTTESVQTFDDLLSDSGRASPWYVDAVAPDLRAGAEMADRMRALAAVETAVTLSDYVPAEQEEKLLILEDISFLLDTPPTEAREAATTPVDEQVQALRHLHDFLGGAAIRSDDSPLAPSMQLLHQRLAEFLAQLEREGEPAAAIERLELLLLEGLPDQLDRLREALEPDEITLESLPADLVQRMVAADGRARVQIFPRDNLESEQALHSFVSAVTSIAPRASGIAINLIAFEEATQRSFQQALLSAIVLIAALLWFLWRRISDTLLVLSPLVLSAALAVAAMGAFDMPFNFVNVIVIPLMFGIGVDSGIHLVHRAKVSPEPDLLGSTTARAVFYSALTTTASFGTLSFSSHRGMASLGVLLTIGMLLTVLCNLVLLPALIELRRKS